jgi:hypothetical protein
MSQEKRKKKPETGRGAETETGEGQEGPVTEEQDTVDTQFIERIYRKCSVSSFTSLHHLPRLS